MKTSHMLIALTALTGCVSHRGVSSAEITPRSELSVRFVAPHALTFRSRGGDTLALDDVIVLRGRMLAVNADSITMIAVSADRGEAGVQRLGQGTLTRFALADVRMQEIQRHHGRTLALVAALSLGLVLLIAIANYEEPPPPPPPEPKPK